NKLSPPRANFSATSPRLVLQAQAVFFNLEESFIKWKDFRRASCIRGGELIRRVRQDLLEMPGCRHFRFTLRFADCCLAECYVENSKSRTCPLRCSATNSRRLITF